MTDIDKKLIRHITADILIFTSQVGGQSIEARPEGKTVLHTRKRGRLE